MRHLILVLVTFVLNLRGLGQSFGSITGTIVDKNTQIPLEFINVFLDGTSLGSTTDTTGYFLIEKIPVGTYNIKTNSVGYKPLTLFNVVITSGNENNYSIELEQDVSVLSEVVIKGTTRTVKVATIETPLSSQRVTTEEIRSNPGGNFDISKVIQTLPGVGGGAGGGNFRNDIIIRGGAPNENVFYLDGIEVPVINHFQTQGSSGGPQGMLNVSFIEDVRLTTSAFDAKYDNAISSVFQFKQKNGNPNHVQGNIRLSATEFAATLEGPLAKNKKTTFLASARRSYLELLFQAIDLPIRPNYWDFQTKINHQINPKTSLTFIGIGAIDEFSFAAPKTSTPEKLYIINSSPLVNQWNYTLGASLKHLLSQGFLNISLSRTDFTNDIKKYEDGDRPTQENLALSLDSKEIETKLRLDINHTIQGWKFAYGASTQLVEYKNQTYNVLRKEVRDSSNQLLQPALKFNFNSPLKPFLKLGAFVQVGKRFADERIGVSAGLRTDMNTFTTHGTNPLRTISPRISISYSISSQWSASASIGSYFKLSPYTILGFADNKNELVNRSSDYLNSKHFVAGLEYIPREDIRFTIEGFYKKYRHVPVSVQTGISLSNLGADFNALGNEPVVTNGKGKAYGLELFAQKKLTDRIFGILSYTFYRSLYNGSNQVFVPSNWDNQHLLSMTFGYKFKRNWELGLKFRYQGGAPYTPFDEYVSRLNYLAQGIGTPDYTKLNTLRLGSFNSSDLRVDKKWNFKRVALDLFLDVTNWYIARNPAIPEYTFERLADNSGFKTSDGKPIKLDGSNAIPTRVKNDAPFFTPTIGFIVEF